MPFKAISRINPATCTTTGFLEYLQWADYLREKVPKCHKGTIEKVVYHTRRQLLKVPFWRSSGRQFFKASQALHLTGEEHKQRTRAYGCLQLSRGKVGNIQITAIHKPPGQSWHKVKDTICRSDFWEILKSGGEILGYKTKVCWDKKKKITVYEFLKQFQSWRFKITTSDCRQPHFQFKDQWPQTFSKAMLIPLAYKCHQEYE